MSPAIAINPNLLGGTPVFAGTRVPIEPLFDALKRGRTLDYFLEQFPAVRREQAEQLLDDAKADKSAKTPDVDHTFRIGL